MSNNETLTVLGLNVSNVKKVRAVEIKPTGEMVVVGGRNAQGKSSVLDAMMYALLGGHAICDRPIRDGEERADVEVDLGELVITRTFTQKGGTLRVKSKDGLLYPKPQSVLDALYNKTTFDPLAFSRMSSRGQTDMLKKLCGLDFEDIDEREAALKGQKASLKTEIASIGEASMRMVIPEGTPDETIDSDEIRKRLDDVDAQNAQNLNVSQKLANVEKQAAEWQRKIEIGDESIDFLRKQIDEYKGRLVERELEKRENEQYLSITQTEITELSAKLHDPISNAAIVAEFAAALDTNNNVVLKHEREDLYGKIAAKREGLTHMTAIAKDLRLERLKRIEAVGMPVDGLSLDGDTLTYRGIPLSQCSSAEQLRVSCAMGFALNPRIKVLVIKDGSLLDEDSLEQIRLMAQEAQAQVWVERVGHGEECQIIIEDGEVVE